MNKPLITIINNFMSYNKLNKNKKKKFLTPIVEMQLRNIKLTILLRSSFLKIKFHVSVKLF